MYDSLKGGDGMLKIKNTETEKHLRVSPKYHQAVKLYAEKRNATIKSVVEHLLEPLLSTELQEIENNPY